MTIKGQGVFIIELYECWWEIAGPLAGEQSDSISEAEGEVVQIAGQLRPTPLASVIRGDTKTRQLI